MTALTLLTASAALYAATFAGVMALARWFGTSRLLWGQQPRSVRLATSIGGAIAAVPAVLAVLELLA